MSQTFSGVSGESNAERLGYRNQRLMSMTLDESLELEPGIYGITVQNPDGKSSASRDAALAVVAPPEIQSLMPPSLCNGLVDQRLTVEGENFVELDGVGPRVDLENAGGERFSYDADMLDDCVELEGLDASIRVCSLLSIEVPARDLPQDDYDVYVTNPEPASCTTSEPAPLKVLDDGPVLFFADPPVAYDGISTRVTLFLTSVTEPFTVAIVPTGELEPLIELEAALVPGKTNRLQATVPAGTEPGVYDVIVNDDSGCQTLLEAGLTLTEDLAIDLESIVAPFGFTDAATPVTIFRAGGASFEATPRGFLNPVDSGTNEVAIQLESLTLVNEDELTAIVPEGAPAGQYDLVIVNPGGEVGVLRDAFASVADPPPVVDDVVPQSIVDQSDQSIEVRGKQFSSASVSVRCRDAGGNEVDPSPAVSSEAEACDGNGDCTIAATIDASSMSRGAVCVVRVENSDGSYGDFSAIGVTNSSFNLSAPQAGRAMNEPRRSLVAAAVKATSASRFLYAIGGDDGAGDVLSSVEFAPVSVFGNMSDFVIAGEPLGTARTRHAGAQLGRYVYVVGGNDGDATLASAERALVLSPAETPVIDDIDLCLSGSGTPCFDDDALGDGLESGVYSYRVAALIDAADPENLGGETLPSDPVILKLPDVSGRNIVVKLVWSAPVDPLGEPLSGVTGFRIYRTVVDGVPGSDEVLLAEVDDPDAREFIDDGDFDLGSAVPLPLGSTSAWQVLPDLGSAREGLSAAVARDPQESDRFHLYALLGEGEATYEHLAITMLPNGRQTVGSAWVVGAEQSAVARSEFGVWVVDDTVSNLVSDGETYLYLGGGLASGGQDDRVEAAKVGTDGELEAFSDDPTAGDIVADFSSTRSGYGTAAAAGRLFLFGGMASQVRDNATAAEMVNPAPSLRNNSWNNEGLTMTSPRYRFGTAVQSAFIFLVGGQTSAANGATDSTEWVVW